MLFTSPRRIPVIVLQFLQTTIHYSHYLLSKAPFHVRRSSGFNHINVLDLADM